MRKEQNELLTQTGPGTLMGALFRRHWLPVLLAEELPEPDCPPVRVTIMSERLLAFRDSEGRPGLIGEFCAHRGVSLWFGRNEQGGIRCAYHGWKYDVTGQCIEVPSEPAEKGFCNKIRLQSYPLVELGGALWAYMGPSEHRPPLPQFEFAVSPAERRFVSKKLQESNYLQAVEGAIDSSHTSFLHRGNLESDPLFKGSKGNQYNLQDLQPKFEVVETPGGLYIGARRDVESGQRYWRITPWVMPCFVMVPPRGEHPVRGLAWVPIDDESCWSWTLEFHPTRPLTDAERTAMSDGFGAHIKLIPGTYRPFANKDNDYLMDRAAQKAGITYCGVAGFAMQDTSVQESMGPIQDRTTENLVPTDAGIVMARRCLAKAAQALAEKGAAPLSANPENQRVRAVSTLLPSGAAFHEAAKEDLRVREGVALTSV